MYLNGFTLDLIELTAHFVRCVGVVVEMRDEIGDRLFKMDIVFPQRVIGIDEQGLRLKKANRLVRSTHQFHYREGENTPSKGLLQVPPVRTHTTSHQNRYLELNH